LREVDIQSIEAKKEQPVMQTKRNGARVLAVAICAAALATLGLAGSASAKLVGEYTKFQQCPWTNTEVKKCLYSVTEGGEVVLGTKKVTVTGTTILQGGTGKQVEGFQKFFAATNGVTLSKTPQAVPGGLLGIVPPEKSSPLVKALSAFFFENGLTGVNSTLELAKPASEIKVSDVHLAEEVGVALEMPIKVKLDNPFLGKNCYVGSSTSPIVFKLTSGTTAPPGPNSPIKGSAGALTLLEGGRILRLDGTVLVDNAWSAPTASGCGGILSFLVNPIINSQIGLASAAGKNTAVLKNTVHQASAAAVKLNDSENP
jgi:hypothetical protein